MPYKVIVWATGVLGSLSLKLVIEDPRFELVGVYVYNPDKEGKDAGELVGMPATGVLATRDRDAIIAMDADCVVHTPLAPSMEELDNDVVDLLSSGKNVVSTAGFFAPEVRGAEVVARLERACATGGTSLHGGGIEPGFMFDRLAPTLTGMSAELKHVRLFETIDAAKHPAAQMILEALAIGKPIDSVTIESPFSQYFVGMFTEVATAFGNALGIKWDRLEPALDLAPATHDFDIAVGHVAEGTIAGSRYSVAGYYDGRHLLDLEVHWFVERGLKDWPVPAERYQWGVEIEGHPSSRTVIDVVPTLTAPFAEGDDPGYSAAAATAVLAIPGVCEAPPGIFEPPVFGAWNPAAINQQTAKL
jgi:hypothetical protein